MSLVRIPNKILLKTSLKVDHQNLKKHSDIFSPSIGTRNPQIRGSELNNNNLQAMGYGRGRIGDRLNFMQYTHNVIVAPLHLTKSRNSRDAML